MLRSVLDRLTSAKVIATVALMVALGGTSIAAYPLLVPRNSVGPAQLRRGAVRSREVKDHSLEKRDFSSSAVRALRGARGPQGAIGPQGPTGPAAVEFFAWINTAGEHPIGDATGSSHTAPGVYTVSFGRSMAGCAITVTVGTSDASTVQGTANVNLNSDGSVGVQVYDFNHNPASLPFDLIAAC